MGVVPGEGHPRGRPGGGPRRAAEATNTLNVDARGAEVMGKETYDFVYGGGGGGPAERRRRGRVRGSARPPDLSDSFEVPAGAEAAATSVTRDGLTTVGSVPSVGGATGTGTETTTPARGDALLGRVRRAGSGYHAHAPQDEG